MNIKNKKIEVRCSSSSTACYLAQPRKTELVCVELDEWPHNWSGLFLLFILGLEFLRHLKEISDHEVLIDQDL